MILAHWLLAVIWGASQAGSMPHPQATESLPKAEAILDKHVEATGGRAAYEKLHNEVSKGTVEFVAAGIKGIFAAYAAEPNKTHSSIDLQGAGKIEEGTDGQVAWETSTVQGPRIKTGEERTVTLREATFNALIRWRELYTTVECVGLEQVEGRTCFKVVLTPDEGKPIIQYFDQQTNLLVKTTMIVKNPMGEIPSETLLSDYRQVNGVRMPHRMVHKVLGLEIVVTLDSIRFNVDIPRDRFDLPAELKALRKRINADK